MVSVVETSSSQCQAKPSAADSGQAAVSSYIPLKDRNVWADVEPIPQEDGPNPLVMIMYAQEYRDAMDYFRAIAASGEHSERVLELTETIIRRNPAHYTVWGYRMATLLALKKDLGGELELMNEFARVNLKSYQVWHHRLTLMTHISPKDPQEEIDYIHEALLPDPKNYHTWAYLHWLFSHFADRITEKQWDEEQVWCENLLKSDARNNSAWGWRWYLYITRSKDASKEIEYARAVIETMANNVSAWNYLRGVLKHSSRSFSEVQLPASRSALALEFEADTLIGQGKRLEAAKVFKELMEKDKMRAAYWQRRSSLAQR